MSQNQPPAGDAFQPQQNTSAAPGDPGQQPQYAAPQQPQYAPPQQPGYPQAQQPYAAQQAYAQQAPYQQAYAAAPPTNTLAIIALISSFFISLAGVICGHIALKQIERTGESGRGLALAGLIIGYVGLAIGAIVVLFYVILIIGLASSSSY